MARPSRKGGKISEAKARKAGPANDRKTTKTKPRIAPAATQANNLQQSWRFDWEPPKAVLRDVWTIVWILGC